MDYWHKLWTCPFFKWDDQTNIGCEGGKVRFPDKKAAVRYMEKYCAGEHFEWEGCSIAASLIEYYQRTG